jgi:hypothetical protein
LQKQINPLCSLFRPCDPRWCPIMHQTCLKHCSGVCHEDSQTRGHVWPPGAMCGAQGPLGATGALLPHYAPNFSQRLFQGSAMKIVTTGAMCGSQGLPEPIWCRSEQQCAFGTWGPQGPLIWHTGAPGLALYVTIVMADP